ncbi:MAG: CinA family protein [Granulosicoccus sp.]
MTNAAKVLELSALLGQMLLENGLSITTAESCTGGLIAGALTEVPGSSAWFERGVVTYSNAAKQELLGVPAATIQEHGAVSEACVLSMVTGAKRISGADIALSVSGVAGPAGGSKEKPVGTVWLAWAVDNTCEAALFHFEGSRHEVRLQAVISALHGTIGRLERRRTLVK